MQRDARNLCKIFSLRNYSSRKNLIRQGRIIDNYLTPLLKEPLQEIHQRGL